MAHARRAPRRNRVDPRGRLVADPARGAWMGNRGVLHDRHGEIRRTHQLERWIICRLEFKGRRRQLMRPGHYTELFFLDEATALAAGHRPCAECQRERFERFREAWLVGNPALGEERGKLPAPLLDSSLHGERIGAGGSKVTFSSSIGELPAGTFVMWAPASKGSAPEPHLLWDRRLWPWRAEGYGDAREADTTERVQVLTPLNTVGALRAGFPTSAAV